MNIKPSAAIRKDYNGISSLCKTTGEPVYLTKNGEGDLVVMDLESFGRRERMLGLQKRLIDAQRRRVDGKRGYTIDETVAAMERAINEVVDGGK